MALPEWTQSGPNQYDYAVNGIPFLSAASKDSPYGRQTAKVNKEQIDTSKEVGEQSLSNWWYRSQSSFDLGAGVKYFDVLQDESLSRRFFDSAGVDILSTIGEATLLRRTVKVSINNASASNQPKTVGYNVSNEAGVLAAAGSVLSRVTSTGTTSTVTWGGASTILDLTTNGSNYFILATDGVYAGSLPNSTGSKLYTTSSTVGAIGWAKERIIACVGTSIYALAPGAGTLPAALFTSNTVGWRWSAVADGPNSIYISGYAGDRSYIYRSKLADNGVDLESPSIVAELPRGEVVYSMITYMGTYVIVGTNKGVRIGVIATDGSIILGSLTIETNNNVKALYANGNFCWVGGADVDGKVGIYRIDLSKTIRDNTLIFPYQKDLATDSNFVLTTEITGIAGIGMTGRLAVATNLTTGYLYTEHATEKVASGWLETGKIRMDTTEEKIFQYLKVSNLPTAGSIAVYWRDETNALSTDPLFTWNTATIRVANMEGSDSNPHPWVSYRFLLTRDSANAANSPVLVSYQAKVTPSYVKQRTIQLSLLCYQSETPINGKIVERSVYDRIKALEQAEEKGSVIVFQDLNTGERRLCVIESITFISQHIGSNPAEKANPGGLLGITLRTVDKT